MFDLPLALILDTVTLGWRQSTGWRLWYGAGATLTLVMLLVRTGPAAGRFFRDTQWTPPAIFMGMIVCTVGPLTALTACSLAWPLVMIGLVSSRRRARSGQTDVS
ncbi:hypothetical protein [Gemmatimonas sp.]|jgi:hypothetical protein|uniref:hypothetical protein n=1 Tax=Gemmatimonas sp. TaxID=1962908 RepID=UPI0022C1A347|nr:hypothetical protein [Gemmatimonas sp.]MCZ8206374.1 hypothetical protein [Gemmatimonas sp.]